MTPIPSKTVRRRAKQHRSKQTVDTILTAAAQVLKRHGYAAATTARIAERAGLSVGSLYQYFSDKDDVIEGLLARESERLAQNMGRFEADPGATLADNLGALIDVGTSNPDIHPPLFHELSKIPAFDDRVQNLRADVAAAFCSLLQPYEGQLAVRDLPTAAQLIVLSCEGVGMGATQEMIEAGILEDLKQMAVSYVLGEAPA